MRPATREEAEQQARAGRLAHRVVQFRQSVDQQQLAGQPCVAAGQAPGIAEPLAGRSRVESALDVFRIAGFKRRLPFGEASCFRPQAGILVHLGGDLQEIRAGPARLQEGSDLHQCREEVAVTHPRQGGRLHAAGGGQHPDKVLQESRGRLRPARR